MPEEIQVYHGAIVDERTETEKLEQDTQFKEIVASAAPVIWKEKKSSEWEDLPISSQNGSGSCVGMTAAKELGKMHKSNGGEFIMFSPADIYQRRANKPFPGMNAIDLTNILKKGGATLEILAPSMDKSDTEMDAVEVKKYMRDIGNIFAISSRVVLPTGDFDAVASVIQKTGKAVMIWLFFEYDEWTDVPTIKHPNLTLNQANCRHSISAIEPILVSALDNTTIPGQQALVIHDSWGKFNKWNGKRLITREFYTKRNYYAGYLANFKYNDQTQPEPAPTPTPGKPQYTFTKELNLGTTNADVKALQDILKYEGLFPTNTASTGFYGATTREAVYKFQVKHQVAPLSELNALMGKTVGKKTIAKLNQLYS